MNRNFVIIALLLFILMFTLYSMFKTQKVKANGTIYIKADGSINPPDAPIQSEDNYTYTITRDIFNKTILIEKNGTIIDGKNHKLKGSGIYVPNDGFHISRVSNVTIKNVKITNYYSGVSLELCDNIVISNNEIINNSYAVYSSWCECCKLIGNRMAYSQGGCVYLVNSKDFTIINNEIFNNNVYGIRISSSLYCRIINNNISNNRYGIYMRLNSNGNSIYHNNFINNQVLIENSKNNKWDDGYPSGGNYWSDYACVDLYSGPYQNETRNDGIGDTPYIIDEDNMDRYPLMHPWKAVTIVSDVNHDGKVDILDVVLAASIYGCRVGEPGWNSEADVAPPYGIINILDLITIAANYGQTTT